MAACHGEGWFSWSTRDGPGREMGPLGAYCNFEGKRRIRHQHQGRRIGRTTAERALQFWPAICSACHSIRGAAADRVGLCPLPPGDAAHPVESPPRASRPSCSPSVARPESAAARALPRQRRRGEARASVAEETTDPFGCVRGRVRRAPLALGAVRTARFRPSRSLLARAATRTSAPRPPARPRPTTTATAPRSWKSDVPWMYAACTSRIRYVRGSTSATAADIRIVPCRAERPDADRQDDEVDDGRGALVRTDQRREADPEPRERRGAEQEHGHERNPAWPRAAP